MGEAEALPKSLVTLKCGSCGGWTSLKQSSWSPGGWASLSWGLTESQRARNSWLLQAQGNLKEEKKKRNVSGSEVR